MNLKKFQTIALMSVFVFICACSGIHQQGSNTVELEQPVVEPIITEVATEVLVEIEPEPEKRKHIRGIHLSAWISGPNKHRLAAMELFDNTELNTAVIDIKEMEGQVFIDGVKLADENKTFFRALPNLEKYLSDLKERGVYTIARIVVFRDNAIPRKKPSMGVKNPDGTLWTDRKGITWLDPYNKDAWEYNIQIAERAVDMGFEEIQFDYIRFPSDGKTSNCRYSNKNHNPDAASNAIVGFLKTANKRLKAKGAKISIDVFGGTTTSTGDMGIGQRIVEMTEWVDYVSPMVYPSHYYSGEFGLSNPNSEPYKVVYLAMEAALKRLPLEKQRPWLQDFSLGYKYGVKEVRDQIQACYDNGIGDWLLWNPRCVYTRAALLGNDAENTFEKSDPPTPQMIRTQERLDAKKAEEEAQKAAKQQAVKEEEKPKKK